MTIAQLPTSAAVDAGNDELSSRMDDVRLAMDSEMQFVQARAKVYLNWYSPPFNDLTSTHDAWLTSNGVSEPIRAEDLGLTRANFPLSRAVVDIWTSLEAANPPTARAETERMQAPPPMLDQQEAMRMREVYAAFKQIGSMRADTRSALLRQQFRLDSFPLKHYLAVRRKNLYGFSWVKVVPDLHEQRARSHVLRNPTVVYPIWSTREPDEIEMLLVAYLVDGRLANAQYGLGLNIKDGRIVLGMDDSRYRELNNRWYDSTRTKVWVEEFWWIDRDFKGEPFEQSSAVSCVKRVAGNIIPGSKHTYENWRHIPYVPYINTDERDSFGWSDIAGVIDINDEFNRRLSQQGDIIGNYAAPRFQMLNSIPGRDLDMPGPFEMIALQDQERIEQILMRIDVFPAQSHFTILTDLLHRVTGLPPIVWGLIANAQTSGRALTASWKATEARLSPKLMANEQSLRRWQDIVLNYFRIYDWRKAGRLFVDADGAPFNDIRWVHPPMEPRDFQEVTLNEITKRDAGLTSTIKAMREIGDEAPEETLEEVMAEFQNVMLHADKVQAFLAAQRAELDNAMYAAQIQQQGAQPPGNLPEAAAQQQLAQGAPPEGQPAQVPPEAAAGAALPPAQPGQQQPVNGAPGSPPSVSTGTLIRNGNVSNQTLEQRRL